MEQPKKKRLNDGIISSFWNDELGQDLIEYTLLMAFVALASAALFLGAGGSIKGIWSNPPACVAGQTSTAEKPCVAPAPAAVPAAPEKK